MLAQPSAIPFLIFNILLLPSLVYSQCILPRKGAFGDKEFPDLSNIFERGYTATVDVSVSSWNSSVMVTEYYDVKNGKGKVDVLQVGEVRTFLYFNDTKEAFTIQGLNCASDTPDDMSGLFHDWKYKDSKRVVLGPSAMLWNARTEYKKDELIYMGKFKDGNIRGIEAEYWRGCLNNLIVDYYFAVKEWHSEYENYGMTAPLLIEIEGEAETNPDKKPLMQQTYEFLHFKPEIAKADKVFRIPTGFGCKRRAKNLPKAPSFDGYDILYRAEVMHTKSGDNDFHFTNVEYMKDEETAHVGYFYSKWRKVQEKDAESATDFTRIIYNYQNGLLYNITEGKNCVVSKDANFDDQISLPGGTKTGINSKLIFKDSDDLVYMGQSKRRGIATDAFEFSMNLSTDSSSFIAIVTKFYVSKHSSYQTEGLVEGAPLQIIMRVIYPDFQTEDLIFNIFEFSTKLRNKNQLFDVQSCSRVTPKIFSLRFQLPNENAIRDTRKNVRWIKEQALQLLIDYSKLTPLRVPEILVDFDTENIYAFATVLERPDYLLDFTLEKHRTLVNADDVVGLYTISQCAKLCLERPGICRAFSHCGATCYLAMTAQSAANTNDTKNCRLYKRQDLDKYPDGRTVTTDAAITYLYSALSGPIHNKPSLFIRWEDDKRDYQEEEVPMTDFEAASMTMDEKFNKKLDDFDSHFLEYKYGAKLNKDESHVKSFGSLPYDACQRLCLGNPECESLSSCLGIQECLISYKYGSEMNDTDFVKNSRCMVITRSYVDTFVEYPGLLIATQADKEVDAVGEDNCARACLKETDFDCASFDSCPRSKEKKDRCLLHRIHFFDVNNRNHEITVDDTGKCGHYSRNYIHDFKKTKGMAMILDDDVQTLKVVDITIEECAKRCYENGAFACKSFDHCAGSDPLDTTCRLNSKDNKEGKLVSSPICDNYATKYIVTKELATSNRKKRFKTGLVVGLGFFFFLIGCGLGIVAVFAYGSITGKRL